MHHNNGDVQLDNIDDYGNFQKYILAKLPVSEQTSIAKEAANMYKEGKLTAQDIRTLADPKDTITLPFLEMFKKELSYTERLEFEEKLSVADKSHEVGKVIDDLLKPITKTGAKIITNDNKRKTIKSAYKGVLETFNPEDINDIRSKTSARINYANDLNRLSMLSGVRWNYYTGKDAPITEYYHK